MKRISTDTLAGILITVSIHLAVIIVLLMSVVEPKLLKEKMNIELDIVHTTSIMYLDGWKNVLRLLEIVKLFKIEHKEPIQSANKNFMEV